jgi:hypothetical protein
MKAVNAFKKLKPGGPVIFDDYLWEHFSQREDNPAKAINTFLKYKKGKFRLVQVNYQVIIQKL